MQGAGNKTPGLESCGDSEAAVTAETTKETAEGQSKGTVGGRKDSWRGGGRGTI